VTGPRIALDAFGTDARPDPEIEAAVRIASSGARIELVGDEARLRERVAALVDPAAATIELIHAGDEIAMDESPARAVRAKPDSSLCVAMDRLRSGHAQALVSAGNSGAILVASLLRLGRIKGIDRPAIVTGLPQIGAGIGAGQDRKRPHTVLLDAGANVECTVLNLVQFAVLGATWARLWHDIERPRVAVLSNGHEAGKGTALTRGAHALLAKHVGERGPAAMFDFVGNVEPTSLFDHVCDVVVTDGWTGNVVLKLAEGAMAAWPRMLLAAIAARQQDDAQGAAAITAAIDPALHDLAHQFDPDAHGGAPLLGVDGAVIICHGASGPEALYSALLMARRLAERGLIEAIGRAVRDHRELFELARAHR
jgi:phosphate acyltransferase